MEREIIKGIGHRTQTNGRTFAAADIEGDCGYMPKNTNMGTFPLRLPRSTRYQATEIARHDGISLNQFITIAVVEMIVRLESSALHMGSGNPGSES